MFCPAVGLAGHAPGGHFGGSFLGLCGSWDSRTNFSKGCYALMSLGDQGRMQIQGDVHCGVPGRDTWVKYCIKEDMLEASGPEMKDASASVL